MSVINWKLDLVQARSLHQWLEFLLDMTDDDDDDYTLIGVCHAELGSLLAQDARRGRDVQPSLLEERVENPS